MWYKIQDQYVELRIFAKPNAKTTALIKIDEQALHIAIHAQPHGGEANKELITYLSKLLRIPKSQIVLQKGEGNRHKQVIIPLTEIVQQFLEHPEKSIR